MADRMRDFSLGRLNGLGTAGDMMRALNERNLSAEAADWPRKKDLTDYSQRGVLFNRKHSEHFEFCAVVIDAARAEDSGVD